MTYDENRFGLWASFHLENEESKGSAQHRGSVRITHQQLDTTIEKNADLEGKATTSVAAARDGVRVIPFSLFRTLRVQSVTSEGGQPLAFIREDKNDDSDFRVILPKALSKGQKYTLTSVYGGKEAVINTGGGNYLPIARDDWYPNSANFTLGEYATYDMTFRIPKNMKIAVTGDLVNDTERGWRKHIGVEEWTPAGSWIQFWKIQDAGSQAGET